MSKPENIPAENIDVWNPSLGDDSHRAVDLQKSFSFSSLTRSLEQSKTENSKFSASLSSFSCGDMTKLNATHFVTERNQEATMELSQSCLKERALLEKSNILKNLKLEVLSNSIAVDAVGDFSECHLNIYFYSTMNGSTIVDVNREIGDCVIFSSIYEHLYSQFFPVAELSSVSDFLRCTKNLSISKRRQASVFARLALTKCDLLLPGVNEAIERLKRSTDPLIQANLTQCAFL